MSLAQRLANVATLVALAGASQAGNMTPGNDRMFNPQPEPPETLEMSNGIDLNPVDKFGFNPQPDPPRAGFNLTLQPELPSMNVNTFGARN